MKTLFLVFLSLVSSNIFALTELETANAVTAAAKKIRLIHYNEDANSIQQSYEMGITPSIGTITVHKIESIGDFISISMDYRNAGVHNSYSIRAKFNSEIENYEIIVLPLADDVISD